MEKNQNRRKALKTMATAAIGSITVNAMADESVKLIGGWQYKDEGYEKHVPEVTVKRKNDIAEITVEVKHPQTAAHHISTFKIYTKARIELTRTDLNPEISQPKTTFYLKIEKDTELIATTDCNIHGIWMKQFKV